MKLTKKLWEELGFKRYVESSHNDWIYKHKLVPDLYIRECNVKNLEDLIETVYGHGKSAKLSEIQQVLGIVIRG